DYPSPGPGELLVGDGVPAWGGRRVVFQTRRNAEASGGFVDTGGSGAEACGHGGTRPGQAISAGAIAGVQADRVAGAAEGACGERAAAAQFAECAGNGGGLLR